MKAKSFNAMDRFRAHWEEFREWVSAQDRNEGKSSMWQNLIRDFAIDDDRRAYGFLPLERETAGFFLRRKVLETSYFIARASSYIRSRAWRLNASGLGMGHLAYHPSGIRWLKELGLYEGWREFCARHRISEHSSNAIKSYYVACVLASAHAKGSRILEIGGGLGTLAGIVQDMLEPTAYVIVDLPEMLLLSSVRLRRMYPEIPAVFLYPGSAAEPQDGFVFCTPETISRLPTDGFDLACNIDSFQEMTEQQVATYIDLAQRVTKPSGLFLNINRRKYLEAERYDNNPLMYPYKSNLVLRWETDVFMDRTMNYDRVRLDGWILRLERLVKESTP
jgi:ubiquinone/menaquinone biosynthesis C-methylase UbiE